MKPKQFQSFYAVDAYTEFRWKCLAPLASPPQWLRYPYFSLSLFPLFRPLEKAKYCKSFLVFLWPLTEGAEGRVWRRSRRAWSWGPSGKTRNVLGSVGRLRLQRFAPALCPLSAASGSGCSGGSRRRQPRRRRPRLERRLKKEPSSRGVRPLVVGGLPPIGAAWRGEAAAQGSRWGPGPTWEGRGARCFLHPWAVPVSAFSPFEPGSAQVGGFAPLVLSLCGPRSEGGGKPGRPRRGPLRRKGPGDCRCPG